MRVAQMSCLERQGLNAQRDSGETSELRLRLTNSRWGASRKEEKDGIQDRIQYVFLTAYLFAQELASQHGTEWVSYLEGILRCEFLSLGLLDLGDLCRRLVAQRGATPVLLDLFSTLVEVGLHSLDELVQGAAVTRFDLKLNSVLSQAELKGPCSRVI